MNIVTSPNQYIVTISPKEKPKSEAFGVVSRKAEVIAGRLLNDRSASHILYYYFALNQDNFKFALSCSEVCKRYDISEKQYRAAIKKLKEAGYLVPDEKTKNGLLFLHIPEDYKNVEPIDNEQAEGQSKLDSPKCTDNLPLKVSQPTPKGIDNLSLKGDRNNTKINNDNNINKLFNSLYDEDNVSDENKKLISKIKEKFGHLDSLQDNLTELLSKNKNDDALKSALTSLIIKYNNNRRVRRNNMRSEYKSALDKTLPNRMIEQEKVKAILNKYISEHKYLVKNCGVWLNGWDEERQEPKVIVAFYPLPVSLIDKQKHNIEGIPREYYSNW